MNQKMPEARTDARRPYVRPIAGWWHKNPFFLRYMAREATALVVAAYAFVLLAGLLCLARGEAAWQGWLAALASAPAILLHVLMLAVMIYHSWTWFEIMPKTMPPMYYGGKRVAGGVITWSGVAAAVIATLAVLCIVLRVRS